MRTLIPRIALVAALLPCLLLAACGSDGAGAAQQTGTLDGMPFTVVAGSVRQSAPGRAVSAGQDGALLIFDDPLSELAPKHRNLRVTATVNFEDGGQVMLGVFGKAGTMADAYGIGARRDGDAFHYRFQYGIPRSGPLAATAQQRGLFAATPRDADATLYFRTEIHTAPTLDLLAWTPWNDIPAECAGGPVEDLGPAPADSGTGQRLGVWLSSATLRGVSLLWATFQGCAQ
ncbi:MAG TPA: hypothetical protein VKB51_17585 [bacterium]|nr:hypothetical protein [bacterium]